MERKFNDNKDMKKEIEYTKRMNYTVKKEQLRVVGKYYKNLTKERNDIKGLEKTDPNKQLEYLKNNYEKLLRAPYFIKDTKFVNVHNAKLYKLQERFEDKDGKYNHLRARSEITCVICDLH